jgi:hypothetical protein
VIHQPETGREAGFAHSTEQSLHFGTGKNHRQDLRFGDAQFGKNSPVGVLEAVLKKAAQGKLRRIALCL